ncbi:MAG: YbaB/EbfC family nucleoid-associated protein [Alphaproteobacteria bacterium]|nr:YbaB/EbfC family nucleoid-associated protein [Alphaproteobacteria bacterium]
MKNLADIMKQAGQMQAKMADMQARLEQVFVEGQSGGGLVKVRMSAKFAVSGVVIDASLLKPEEKEILEDLLMAALNDAKGKAEAAAADEMKSLTAGLPLPPGFKLPF